MATKKLDFPIHRDPTTRFLPWIIAFMVFLSVLAMVGFIIMNKEVSHWQEDVNYQFTVSIPSMKNKQQDKVVLIKVINGLRGVDKVVSVSPLSQSDISQLLKPWFSDGNLLKTLPLPHLISVIASAGNPPTSAELSRIIKPIVKTATIDDHSIWLAHIVSVFSSIRNGSLGILLLVLLAMIGTVVFTTRTGISVHADVLKVLYLIGAQNKYIATQFAYQATRLSFWGVIIGMIFSSPVFYTLWKLNHTTNNTMMFSQIHMGSLSLLLLIIVPSILAIIIARITAWLTVMFVLKSHSNR